MRLFVAIDVPEEIKGSIETDVVVAMRDHVDGAKWTRREGRHLTLKFLGEVDDVRGDEIGDAIGSAASKHDRFDAAFGAVGGFPTLRRPRVLWVGIDMGAEAMVALASDVERALEPLGFPAEGRPFTAHLTLARFPRPRVIEELPSVDVPHDRFVVDGVTLFRSQLHPKGARYTALSHFALR